MQGHHDAASFIQSFTGSNHFILDYLVEEVLQKQSPSIQTFMLHTSILGRFCGPLCEAVLGGGFDEPSGPLFSGQEILEYLERANLFIVPLDNERRWYRYHHLFADLLRQRLRQGQGLSGAKGEEEKVVTDLHIRASQWFEDNCLEIEALHHAAAANDVERAARLVEGGGMPLLFRGAPAPVLNWLDSLPMEVLDAKPPLWVMYAAALLMAGQVAGVEPKLRAAEKALQSAGEEELNHDHIGHIASIRATLAVTKHEAETIMAQSRRALKYLHPDNLPVRAATTWTLGYAYQLQGERSEAGKAYAEALSISQRIGHVIVTIMASLGLGNIQEAENQLYAAAETYRHVLQLAGDPSLPVACEAHLGLARIFYEWNDLDAAKLHGQQSVQLARRLEQTDRVVAGEAFLACLMLTRGEAGASAAMLAKADLFARQHNFLNQTPLIAAANVLALLHQGNLDAAYRLAKKHELHISLARVHLAQGNSSAAMAALEPSRRHAEEKGWLDEQLKIKVLQAAALHAHGETSKAVQLLLDALTMALPGGFIRIFLDEGIHMYRLLSEAAALHMMPDHAGKLLAEFEAEELKREDQSVRRPVQPPRSLIEPLSERELEVLHLIAQGLSNREISERLFLALSTVKGHNRNIFDKLQVGRRTEAVALARKLGLL